MNPKMNASPPARPWQVQKLRDLGPGIHYRFHVQGLNHHFDPPSPFRWGVHELGDQYDLDAVADELGASSPA
jgi:hypothetical protein